MLRCTMEYFQKLYLVSCVIVWGLQSLWWFNAKCAVTPSPENQKQYTIKQKLNLLPIIQSIHDIINYNIRNTAKNGCFKL